MRRKMGTGMGIGILMAMSMISHANGATCDRNYDVSLTKAVAATVAAVATDNAPALLNQFSPDGVAFGTDGPLVSLAALREQFTARSGKYCDLFTCGAKPGQLRRLFVMGHVDKQIDAAHGLASVVINANTNDELDLSYRFTGDCKWQITGIGAP